MSICTMHNARMCVYATIPYLYQTLNKPVPMMLISTLQLCQIYTTIAIMHYPNSRFNVCMLYNERNGINMSCCCEQHRSIAPLWSMMWSVGYFCKREQGAASCTTWMNPISSAIDATQSYLIPENTQKLLMGTIISLLVNMIVSRGPKLLQ